MNINKQQILKDIKAGVLKRTFYTPAARPSFANFGVTFRYTYDNDPNEWFTAIESNPYCTEYSKTGYSLYYNTVKASESKIRQSVFDSLVNESITKEEFQMAKDLYDLEKQTPRCDYELA